MAVRKVSWAIVAAFAAAVGHLGWHTLAGPPVEPDYLVGGDGPALAGADPDARVLHLRRELYLPQRPRHAWLQAVGHDRLRVYVNGLLLQDRRLDGFPVALLADAAPLLKAGKNVIAVTAKQCSVGRPPRVGIEGAYLLSDGEHHFGVDGEWRCNTFFERQGSWWYTAEFDDRKWPFAQVVRADLRGKLRLPPRAVTEPAAGRWVTPPDRNSPTAGLRRDFTLDGQPAEGW